VISEKGGRERTTEARGCEKNGKKMKGQMGPRERKKSWREYKERNEKREQKRLWEEERKRGTQKNHEKKRKRCGSERKVKKKAVDLTEGREKSQNPKEFKTSGPMGCREKNVVGKKKKGKAIWGVPSGEHQAFNGSTEVKRQRVQKRGAKGVMGLRKLDFSRRQRKKDSRGW